MLWARCSGNWPWLPCGRSLRSAGGTGFCCANADVDTAQTEIRSRARQNRTELVGEPRRFMRRPFLPFQPLPSSSTFMPPNGRLVASFGDLNSSSFLAYFNALAPWCVSFFLRLIMPAVTVFRSSLNPELIMKKSIMLAVAGGLLFVLPMLQAADITGKVILKGTPPKEKEIPQVKDDANCGKLHTSA